MKGIVVDRQGAYAAVLDDRGAVRRVRDRHYAIGQQVSLAPRMTRRGAAALAAALTLLLSLGTVAVLGEYADNGLPYLFGMDQAVLAHGHDLLP